MREQHGQVSQVAYALREGFQLIAIQKDSLPISTQQHSGAEHVRKGLQWEATGHKTVCLYVQTNLEGFESSNLLREHFKTFGYQAKTCGAVIRRIGQRIARRGIRKVGWENSVKGAEPFSLFLWTETKTSRSCWVQVAGRDVIARVAEGERTGRRAGWSWEDEEVRAS